MVSQGHRSVYFKNLFPQVSGILIHTFHIIDIEQQNLPEMLENVPAVQFLHESELDAPE